MAKDPHFTALKNMYLAAPVNAFYRPTIDISDAAATIEIEVAEQMFHSAGAVHGSVYFVQVCLCLAAAVAVSGGCLQRGVPG